MATLQNEDVMAPPVSSDEEENVPVVGQSTSATTTGRKRKVDTVEETSTSKRRIKSQLIGTRRSRRTAIQNKDPEPRPLPDSSLDMPDFLNSSQSSQQRKRKAQYGKPATLNRSNSRGNSFTDPGELPSTPRKKAKDRLFRAPEDVPGSRKWSPKRKKQDIQIPSFSEEPLEKNVAFTMPDELENLPNSSSTSTELSLACGGKDSPSTTARKRSSSTSSLSSVDSIASYELSQKQKDDISGGTQAQEHIPKGSIRCPLCQRAVDITKPVQPDPTDLSLRKQQTFCQTHRVRDAHIEWAAQSYPKIDWHLLDKKRIPGHISHLRQILYRKHPSFYLEALESAIKGCRGSNDRKIQRYLSIEAVDLVKPGYYGPRGAKVMTNKITIEMSNHLKRSLRADSTVRAVGVAGFVSAVLLPELLLQIVKEDMDIIEAEDEAARKVIAESTEVGMLLWPDDDHVTVTQDHDNSNKNDR